MSTNCTTTDTTNTQPITTAVLSILFGISELLPFFGINSANGILHGILMTLITANNTNKLQLIRKNNNSDQEHELTGVDTSS